MKINFNRLRTGDTFFVKSYTPFGLIVQTVTGWDKPTHCGKIIKLSYMPYVVEMIGDLNPFNNDMHIRPITYYTRYWRFWTSVVSIKRSHVYDDDNAQSALIRWTNEQSTIKHKYDYKEAISHAFKNGQDSSPNLICSRLVYDADEMLGVDFGEDSPRFVKKVSPVDLWESPAYFEVPDWKKKKDEKNRFRNILS